MKFLKRDFKIKDMIIFRLGPKKVILREGHNAESFYFILAGTGLYCISFQLHMSDISLFLTPQSCSNDKLSRFLNRKLQGIYTISFLCPLYIIVKVISTIYVS